MGNINLMKLCSLWAILFFITAFIKSNCVHVAVHNLTYDAALKYCNEHGANLPRTGYNLEQNISVVTASEHGLKSFWVLRFNYSMGKFVFEDEATFSPDVRYVSGDCGLLDIDSEAYIQSIECNLQLPGFICKYPAENSRCIQQHSIKIGKACYDIKINHPSEWRNWEDSRRACILENMKMARFSNYREMELMKRKLQNLSFSNKLFWISLKRQKSTLGWMPEEPKQLQGDVAVINTKYEHKYLLKVASQIEKHSTICLGNRQKFLLNLTSDANLVTSTHQAPRYSIRQDNEEMEDKYKKVITSVTVSSATALILIIISIIIILKLCRKQKQKEPTENGTEGERLVSVEKNVILVGEISSGKSSFINSIIMALGAAKYNQWAKVGCYGEDKELSITRKIFAYELRKNPTSSALQGVKLDVLDDRVLTIWDIPGLSSQIRNNRNKLLTFLKRLLCGKIPSRTTYKELESSLTKCQIMCDSTCEKSKCKSLTLKFDCIIFVHNVVKKVPDDIANALKDILNESNSETHVIAVFTHIDLVDGNGRTEEARTERNTYMEHQDDGIELQQLRTDTLENKKERLRSILGIEKQNCFDILQYCSDITLEKDEKINKQLKSIIDFIFEDIGLPK